MLPFFAAGAAVGWRWRSAGLSADSGKPAVPPQVHEQDTDGMADGQEIPGLPKGSGLPGDWSHLSGITDVRALRGEWEKSDEDSRDRLAARWLALDPADGLMFLFPEEVLGDSRDRDRARDLANEWAEKDPIACFQFLITAPQGFVPFFEDNLIDGGVAGLVAAQLAADSAQVQAAWKSAGPELRRAMAPAWIGHLLRTDPAQGARELLTLPVYVQYRCWDSFRWSHGAGVALDLLSRHPEIVCPPETLVSLIGSFSHENLPEARIMAEKLPAGAAREKACSAMVEKMQQEKMDPAAVLDWVEVHAPTKKNLDRAYGGMLTVDPGRGLALYARHPVRKPEYPLGRPYRSIFPYISRSALGNYVQELARADWAAALALAGREDAGEAFRSEVLGAMAGSLSYEEGNPVPKLNQLSGVLAGKGVRSEYISRFLFAQMPSEAFPAAAAWLGEQPVDVRELLLPLMASRFQEGSEAGTGAALLSQLPESGARTENLMRNLSFWAVDDPQSAAAFSQSLPPGTDHDYAILNTAAAWSRHDPAAARRWVDSLPDSSAKTLAVKELDVPRAPAR